MQKSITIFFQIVVVVIGIAALTFMLWEPHVEGVNANAAFFEVYQDSFLVYAYIASLAFFTALYQIFKLLGYVRERKVLSEATLKALRTIQYCGLTLIAFLLVAEVYLFTVQRKIEEDIAGSVAMGLFLIIISGITAAIATKLKAIVKRKMMAS